MPNFTSRRRFVKQSILAGAAVLSGLPDKAGAVSPFQRPFGPQMKLSCTAWSYRKYLLEEKPPSMTIEGFLVECAKMGLGAAEPTSYYFPSPLTVEFLRRYKRKAFLLGLDLSEVGTSDTFTYPPGPEREKNLDHVKQWIDYTAILGAPALRIFAGHPQEGASEEQARKWCIETTREACAHAEKRGVFLAMENHWDVVRDAERLIEVVQAVESDWFGVALDSGNLTTDDPYADLVRLAPYAVNMQLKAEIQPGGGPRVPADIERIIGILAEADYRGYVAVDYEAQEEPREAIPRFVERLQRILSRM